jgi:c(7)-type cytochrome triheme protein
MCAIKHIRSRKKPAYWLALTFTTGGILLYGCSNNQLSDFDRFLNREPAGEPENQIFQKQYTSGSLPRAKLDALLEASLYTGERERYGDVIFREKSLKHKVKPVVFSHSTHRSRFTCRVCHTELEFSMKKGETDLTREECQDGFYCGACHNGEIAFSTQYSCNLCHIKVDSRGNYKASLNPLLSGNHLPKQKYGDGINWVLAINNGKIAPVNSIMPEPPPEMMALPDHLELPLRWTTTAPRTVVSFPHKEHVQWLDCANCHPDMFSIKKMGTVEFNKEKNLYGMYCGTCHMTVAFPMNGCNRCHPDQKDRINP